MMQFDALIYKKYHCFLCATRQVGGFVYCLNVKGLNEMGGIQYCSTEWSLSIDSWKRTLKCVLLNGNKYGALLIGHSVTLKEKYENIKVVL